MRAPADAAEQRAVDEVYQIFAQSSIYRVNHASMCEEVAQIVAPDYVNTFFRESYNFPGLKKTQMQVDASGMVANQKFGAICDSMITPFAQNWHILEASNPYVQKDRQVRLWMEQASHILFDQRYRAHSAFRKNNQQIFQMVGVFGNGPMFIDQLMDMHDRPVRAFRYKALPFGEVFIRCNHQGQVDAFVRAWRMTARNAKQKWGEDMLPQELAEACDKNSEAPFDFFHCVYPNTDYDPSEKIGKGSKPFCSRYVSCTGRRLMNRMDAGYNSFPMSFARGQMAPGEIYGRGWAMDVLPALKTLNAQKATALKVGHRNADPTFITSDDGLVDFKWLPGFVNKGGLTSDGKRLIDAVTPGNYQVAIEQMNEEKALIGDMAYTTIFQTLVENPQMTATQVIELINQKGIFLAPMVGGMGTEYLDSLIEREVDLAQQMYLLPPMPPLLKEAEGEFKIKYVSPLFRAARAGEASGFLRTVETATQIAGQTGDSSVLDWADFDTALPEIARIQSTPESWMASPDKVAAKRQAREQRAQQDAQIQALPAQAAMLKAQAVVAKNGGGIPAGQGAQAA
jgi:hypothetical protein